MIRDRRRRPLSLVVAVSMAFALGACSGDDTPTSSASSTMAPVSTDGGAPATDTGTQNTSTAVSSPASSPPTSSPPVSAAPTTVAVTAAEPDRTVPEGGGESLGPLGETEVELDTDEGTVQIGSGDVPIAAATLPLPDDFVVQLASETPTDLGVTGTTSLSFDVVVALYETGLPDAGYEITERTGSDGVFLVLAFESSAELGDVVIATTPGSDDLTITLALADR